MTGDIRAEQEKVQRDLERAQASLDHLGEVLKCTGCGLDYHYVNGRCVRCDALAPRRTARGAIALINFQTQPEGPNA